MAYKPTYGANRASGIMKTKALIKSSALFNLGKGSPAKVACGGPLQPPCAKVKEVLSQVKETGKYTNAQDINAIPTLSSEEKKAAVESAREDFKYASEDAEISKENLRKTPRSKSEIDNPNSKFNYVKSIANRDKQLRSNARVAVTNATNNLNTQNITNFTDASTKGKIKKKNENYLEKKYNDYLSKGPGYTSKVDFSTFQASPKTISQFTNPTVDKYEKK